MADWQLDSNLNPFARLTAAHREIEARLAELDRAADETADETLRAPALEVISDVLGYFDDGPGAVHHADEVGTLFPQLRPLEAFTKMLAAFEFQHQMNDTAFAELRAALEAFEPSGQSRLRELARHFAELQRAHIKAEELALFPLAAQVLPVETIKRMGVEMAARGGR